jgi:hypothetical protein
LLRSQTVLLPSGTVQLEKHLDRQPPEIQTRAQRAHWRLSWQERLARNARPSTAPQLTLTLHGLPATFANRYGLALLDAAYPLIDEVSLFSITDEILACRSLCLGLYLFIAAFSLFPFISKEIPIVQLCNLVAQLAGIGWG